MEGPKNIKALAPTGILSGKKNATELLKLEVNINLHNCHDGCVV